MKLLELLGGLVVAAFTAIGVVSIGALVLDDELRRAVRRRITNLTKGL